MSYYEQDYPPHEKPEIISDGDSKKNILNRERKESGVPDAGTKGRESKNTQDKRQERDFTKERQDNLAKKADLADKKIERISEYNEAKMEQEADLESNSGKYEEGYFSDYEEAMSEIDSQHEVSFLESSNSSKGATAEELKEIKKEDARKKEFFGGAGKKPEGRVKHIRG